MRFVISAITLKTRVVPATGVSKKHSFQQAANRSEECLTVPYREWIANQRIYLDGGPLKTAGIVKNTP